jgi:hypothetical protein
MNLLYKPCLKDEFIMTVIDLLNSYLKVGESMFPQNAGNNLQA